MRKSIALLLFLLPLSLWAQNKTDRFLEDILLSNKDSLIQNVLQHKDEHRLQIIYTEINRNKQNTPSFKNYYFNVDSALYFNPASTVKMPLAFLSLEKLNNMHVDGVNKYTTLQIDSSYPEQAVAYIDSTAQSGRPSIAHYIKKAFLVSDNDAYNRMYEFIGQQTINENLHAKGYTDVRITRQFKPFTPEENRHTNAIRFTDDKGNTIYTQPPASNTDSFYFPRIVKMGKGYMNRNDSLINEPIDFTTANNISLEDLQQILQSVLFPASVPAKQRFNLTDSDYHFLYQYLSQFPSETNYPNYDTSVYYNSYVKFYFRSSSHSLPDGVRVFNKVGWAYGFLIDVSYVVDFKHKVEYMLASTLYTNSDGILNDDKYDYDTVGWPFMYKIGQTIYQYELNRKRKYAPDLSRFIIGYEKRKDSNRPTIKEVDN
jgi:hypothetical protein